MNEFSEPHEGIRGTGRHGDPLASREGSLATSEMMGYLFRATMVGNPAPVVRDMGERIQRPVVGDAVVVADSMYSRSADTKVKGVGYLVAKRAEWAMSDAEWQKALADDDSLTSDDRWVEKAAWYVQYGPNPGDVCRWTNCMVLAIPRAADRSE